MNYIALYRKYRPANFEEVSGQDVIVKILKNSITEKKISHAYLFSGPRGTGKTSVAKIFSHAVNCITPIDGEPCGKCEICKKLKDNMVDVIEMDAASNNGVDEIREIRNNVKLAPSFCKYKIYIIDEVHMLSSGAFNALLKTLEEPPQHVIFILATTEIQKIPLTIISRCQRFDFKKITITKLEEKLEYIAKKEKIDVDKTAIKLISQISDGGFRDAINILDQLNAISSKKITLEDIYKITGTISEEIIEQLFVNIKNHNLKEGLTLTNRFYETGKNLSLIANQMLLYLRDININNNLHNYFDKEYEERLNIFTCFNSEYCFEMSNILIKLIEELKKSHTQNIIFEVYYLYLYNFYNKENIGEESQKNISREIMQKNDQKNDQKKSKINLAQTPANRGFEEKPQKKIKEIFINNILSEASKEDLKNLKNNFQKRLDFISSKKYNNIVNILNYCEPVVCSKNYILFKCKLNIDLFESNIEKITNFMEQITGLRYEILGIKEEEWIKEKQNYINNRRNGVIYKKIENIKDAMGNTKIKSENKDLPKIVKKAVDIFGESNIIIK